jgi:hypothetical protein
VNHLKRHLNVANVLSAIALFMALGGVTYAATAAKNSVKAKSIAKQAVTTAKLKNGAVTTPKLRNGAVVAAKIGNGAVGTNQIDDGAVRASKLGGGVVTTSKLQNGAVIDTKLGNNSVTTNKLTADAVATGKIQDGAVTASKLASSFNAQLVKNPSLVTKSDVVNNGSPKTISADCPTGKQAIGGGARITDERDTVALTESFPKADAQNKPIGWTATAREMTAEAEDWTFVAYAICAEP